MRFGNIDAFFVCENGPSGSLPFDQHHWGRLELLAFESALYDGLIPSSDTLIA